MGSPYDRDDPNWEDPLEPFYDLLYEKFPWVEDLVDSDPDAWPREKIQREMDPMLTWVLNQAWMQGKEDALSGLAEGER